MKKFDILSLGSIYLDINSTNFPFTDGLKAETETVGKDYRAGPGGSAVNFSLISSYLGLKPVFIGKVGNDIFGNIVNKQLKKNGIEPALIVSDTHSTNLGMNFINPEGKTLMTVAGSANQSLEANEITQKIYEHLDEISYLYLGGYFKLKQLHDQYPNIIATAKQKGVKIILDHGRVSNNISQHQLDSIKEILPQIDIYLPSKDEFLKVFSCPNIKEGLRIISKLSPSTTTVVKDAENGAFGMNKNNKIIYAESHKIKPINTVGAGDTFNAGFIKAQIDNKSFKESIEFAHKVAAYKISKNKYPTLPDLQ
jgi:sugar/nucleoside kinase (ribokinase family)